MISFFRKIRQKLLSQNRVTRYLVYSIGEILLVTVGILIALQVNNWNENRLNRILETKYLKGLQRDLNRDIDGLDLMTTYRKEVIDASLKVMKMNPPNTIEELQEANDEFLKILFWEEFTPNNNTFKELTSSGNLSLVKSDSIKDLLMSLESINAEIAQVVDHLRHDYDRYLYDELANFEWIPLINMDTLGLKNEFVQINDISSERLAELNKQAKGILENGTIRNGWKLAVLNNAFILGLYDKNREMNARLQELIESELY